MLFFDVTAEISGVCELVTTLLTVVFKLLYVDIFIPATGVSKGILGGANTMAVKQLCDCL